MKRTEILLLLILCVAIYSCDSRRNVVEEKSVQSAAAISLSEPPPLDANAEFSPPSVSGEEVDSKTEVIPDKTIVDKKKIIKDGNISIKTKDIAGSKKGIDELLKSLNGYYESEDLQNNDQATFYNLKIRVPSNNFEKLISTVENGKDEVVSKNIQARDVSEEYVDIESRLVNKREYLKRYKELLSKVASVKDILALQETIRNLQEEIESKEGRLRYLSDQVSYSTLNLNIHQGKEFVFKPQEKDRFSERVKKSLSGGWTAIVEFSIFMITIWPIIILAIVSYFIVRRSKRQRKN